MAIVTGSNDMPTVIGGGGNGFGDNGGLSAILLASLLGNRGFNDGHGRGDNGHLDLANQIAGGNDSLGDKIHNSSINNLKETSDAARDTADAVRDAITATNQIGNINLQSTERNGGETRAAVERGTGATIHAIDSAANQIQRDFAGISRDICTTRQEMSEGFGKTNLELAKQHGEIKLEMCKQHGDIQRQVDARAAEAAKQLAECCCKLEAENAQTRQLLQSQTLDEARRREGDLQNQVNLLKFAQMSGSNGGPPGQS